MSGLPDHKIDIVRTLMQAGSHAVKLEGASGNAEFTALLVHS